MSTKRSTTASSIVPLPRGTCSIWGTLVARYGCGHDKTPGVVAGVWVECWGVRSAGDLAGLEAGGAHVYALRGDALEHLNASSAVPPDGYRDAASPASPPDPQERSDGRGGDLDPCQVDRQRTG